LVSESSAFGLHDLQLMVKMLNELRKDFGVVINRYHGEHTIVQEYLEKSQIPLLMEIPFKKEYAELYSESKLIVNNDEEMRKAFLELFENVKSQYLQKAMYR
jgi:MinD superfamily P-loop ATPase